MQGEAFLHENSDGKKALAFYGLATFHRGRQGMD
jgi:hypothetical protein